MPNISKSQLEDLVRQIITSQLKSDKTITPDGLVTLKVPNMTVSEANRMDTGNPDDIVYTKDLVTLDESPRLGCGLMVMKNTTFDWTLNYDEVDYVIDGSLSVIGRNGTATAQAGEIILIPKGSQIKFSVKDEARFIYVTYPADWQSQK
ncbi:cupin domain-containing protein [Loigolactobacillus jiayinensis]|uniref:Ethanolamine utilization protein EutQ n=1 Tax=Loigolactobacillus jiayinensis TaxID=2486016 RepID=A0ABW1RH62_9LACO|nr:ethanolamine utilization protein EutQ [Loigolactobacillus jiayinensis]